MTGPLATSSAADRAALWTVFMAVTTATAMVLEWVWGAGWRWELSSLILGLAAVVLPMVLAMLVESYEASRPSVDWLDLPPFAPAVVRPGAVDEVAEPTVGPTSPGSAGTPQAPPVKFGNMAPPAAYFDPMAANPDLVDPTVRFPSAREGS
jgi:hypothetical protein